jgi:hypothetical protein
MDWIWIFAVAVVVSVGFFFERKRERKRKRDLRDWERKALSDEEVVNVQLQFERRLEENSDLPDAVKWRGAYIYRYLMSKWFKALIAKYRYDEGMARKLKGDWLEYLHLLESCETTRFLALESTNEAEQKAYEDDESRERRRIEAIEDAFAAAMGDGAIEELARVRVAPHGSFDRSGKKPIAPDGYRYSPVSLRPYDEELIQRS